MKHSICFFTSLIGLAAAITSWAQDQSSSPAPAAPPAWSAGGFAFGGLLDGYYDVNFNHPADRTNQIRVFDVRANQFALNVAKFSVEHAADPVGVRVDLGFGRGMDLFHFNEPDFTAMKYVEQAFVSWKPAKAKGFQADFGKFVSSCGAEVFETNSNWNYSRSLLYGWAQPFYHFGLRTSMPLSNHFSAGVQVVNGWNNVEDNNTGKTVGLTGTFTSQKVSWTNTYYVGPEKKDTNDGLRHCYDSVLLLTPNSKLNAYLNFDYVVDKMVLGGENRWVGIAGAARYQANSWFALSPRLEWFNDADGFNTGTAQQLKEFTLTGEFKLAKGLLTRLEYRRDWSDQLFFNRGNELANHKSQDTVLVGVVAYFGAK
jgi:hypothetical protein